MSGSTGNSSHERLQLRCGAMVHGGACLARDDERGRTIFVDGAIPGELVEAQLIGRRGGTWRARVVAVVEASEHRVPPPCPYVPECGGCDLQHVAYAHQLSLKREIVRDAMRRQHVQIPEDVPVHGMASPWRYRLRGEFHVIPGKHGMADAELGFNRARSWTPIAVEDCLIHHPTITESLPALREVVRQGAGPELSVLHLTAGEEGKELLVRPRPPAGLADAALTNAVDQVPAGVHWTTDSVGLRWRGHGARVRAESFIQVNWQHMEVLYGRVIDLLGDLQGMRIIDAYAGIGVLSAVLAEDAAEVVCIEENRTAVRMGQLNAELNGVADRVRYVASPVEQALSEVGAEARVDAVILDPPRAGCASTVVGWLALAGPARIVYVSCDPATLARDLRILVTSGPYQLRTLEAVDMFPQTHHVECVAQLVRQ